MSHISELYRSPLPQTAVVLNTSITSRFQTNSTVSQLLSKLMVENWNSSHSFEQYFYSCNPSECTYSYSARNDLVFIITTLISIVGGLIKSLKIIVPFIIKLVLSRKLSNQTSNTSRQSNDQTVEKKIQSLNRI